MVGRSSYVLSIALYTSLDSSRSVFTVVSFFCDPFLATSHAAYLGVPGVPFGTNLLPTVGCRFLLVQSAFALQVIAVWE